MKNLEEFRLAVKERRLTLRALLAAFLLTSCGPMYPSKEKPCTWYRTDHCYQVK